MLGYIGGAALSVNVCITNCNACPVLHPYLTVLDLQLRAYATDEMFKALFSTLLYRYIHVHIIIVVQHMH